MLLANIIICFFYMKLAFLVLSNVKLFILLNIPCIIFFFHTIWSTNYLNIYFGLLFCNFDIFYFKFYISYFYDLILFKFQSFILYSNKCSACWSLFFKFIIYHHLLFNTYHHLILKWNNVLMKRISHLVLSR